MPLLFPGSDKLLVCSSGYVVAYSSAQDAAPGPTDRLTGPWAVIIVAPGCYACVPAAGRASVHGQEIASLLMCGSRLRFRPSV